MHASQHNPIKLNKSNFNIYNSKYYHSFLFPFIISKLDIYLYLPENSEPIVQYVFGVIILSLIAILSFINVFAYLIIISYYNKKKYPKLKRIINYYKKKILHYYL